MRKQLREGERRTNLLHRLALHRRSQSILWWYAEVRWEMPCGTAVWGAKWMTCATRDVRQVE